MGLRLNWNSTYGVVLPWVYARAENLRIEKRLSRVFDTDVERPTFTAPPSSIIEEKVVVFNVGIYVGGDTKRKPFPEGVQFTVPLKDLAETGGVDVLAQCYLWIKANDVRFADAEDA